MVNNLREAFQSSDKSVFRVNFPPDRVSSLAERDPNDNVSVTLGMCRWRKVGRAIITPPRSDLILRAKPFGQNETLNES